MNYHVQVTRFKIAVEDERLGTQGHCFKMGICFHVWVYTDERSLNLLLVLLEQSIDNTVLRREAHVVGRNGAVGPGCVFEI